MSDAVINLISGVIGALVGGAASLAGTVMVGRMQFVRSARVRIFREILPKISERTLPAFLAEQESDDCFNSYVASVAELAREAQVAGRPEGRAMRKIFALNTGSEDALGHGTFEIVKDVVVRNQSEIVDALFELGYEVSHRIR